jgi:hypothetical protein
MYDKIIPLQQGTRYSLSKVRCVNDNLEVTGGFTESLSHLKYFELLIF